MSIFTPTIHKYNDIKNMYESDESSDNDGDGECYSDFSEDFPELDSVVTSVIHKFINRANFGKDKYGTDLDREDLTFMPRKNIWMRFSILKKFVIWRRAVLQKHRLIQIHGKLWHNVLPFSQLLSSQIVY